MESHAPQPRLTAQRSLRAAIAVFLVAPCGVVLLAAGVLFLWENPWLLAWLWIPIPACWLIAWVLLRIVKRRWGPVWQPGAGTPLRWSATDQAAWDQVVAYADRQGDISQQQFFSTGLYRDTVTQLATGLAEHYHGATRDAVDALTIPEILTAVELAVSDVRQFIEDTLPGSHLLTVGWLRRAPQVSTAWRRIRPVYYAASLMWRPWSTLPRLAASGVVVNPVIEELKQESLTGIYRAFVLQLGKYLIELNSGRLRVGPTRWRALMEQSRGQFSLSQRTVQQTARPTPDVAEPARAPLQIVVAGQVKAGKSSLINGLLGERRAAADILPLPGAIEQYRLQAPHVDGALVLLDTMGYGHAGPAADQLKQTMSAARQAAMILLVVNACDPAHDPDARFLSDLGAWFTAHPQYRRPPILVVVTHIDGLPPRLEWTPPYPDWPQTDCQRPKERHIREAVEEIRRQLVLPVSGIVPACTDVERERAYGIEEWVVPALINLLPQAEAKHLVDLLFAESSRRRLSTVLTQLRQAAKLLVKFQFCGVQSVLPGPFEPPHEERSGLP